MEFSKYYTESEAAVLLAVNESELARAEAWFRKHFSVDTTTRRIGHNATSVETRAIEWKNFLGILAAYRKDHTPLAHPVGSCL